MSRQTIAIDIDDVLSDFASGFVKFCNERWGTHLTINDYDENWTKIWNVDEEEARRRADEVQTGDLYRDLPHSDMAAQILAELSERFHLIVITSRRRPTREDTLAWMAKHYPMIDASMVNFAGFWDGAFTQESCKMTKADIATSLNVSYLIDDQLKHCISAAEAGIESIIFGDYPWNQIDEMPSSMTRCANWLEVSEYFDGR